MHLIWFRGIDRYFVFNIIIFICEVACIVVYLAINSSAIVSLQPAYYNHTLVAANVKACVELDQFNLEISTGMASHLETLALELLSNKKDPNEEMQGYLQQVDLLIESLKPVIEKRSSFTYAEKRKYCLKFQKLEKQLDMSGFGNNLKVMKLSRFIRKVQSKMQELLHKKTHMQNDAYSKLDVLDKEGFSLMESLWDKLKNRVSKLFTGSRIYFNAFKLEELHNMLKDLEMNKGFQLPDNVLTDKTLLQFKRVHGGTIRIPLSQDQERFLELKYQTIPKLYNENIESLRAFKSHLEETELVIMLQMRLWGILSKEIMKTNYPQLLGAKQREFEFLVTAIHGRPLSFLKTQPVAMAACDRSHGCTDKLENGSFTPTQVATL